MVTMRVTSSRAFRPLYRKIQSVYFLVYVFDFLYFKHLQDRSHKLYLYDVQYYLVYVLL